MTQQTQITTALHHRRLLLVWADVPFPPADRSPCNPALTINRWQQQMPTPPPLLLPLDQLPPLPILTLDPTDRIETAFRQANVPLHTIRTQHDPPARDRHNLLKLGGDLAARAGLLLSWHDVRAAPGDPDKAHILRQVRRLAQDSTVLVIAPSPTAAFARLWTDLLAPAVQGAAHCFVLGPEEFAWPVPLVRLESNVEDTLATLAANTVPPPVRDVHPHLAPPAPPPGPIRDRWALLVGVNRYVDPAFAPLNFCVNDVLTLEATLKDRGYTVVTLHDDTDQAHLFPTRENVEAELVRICQAAQPDDLLWVHFACHGKLMDGQPVLVTHETRAPTLARKALPLAEVERHMRASAARRLILTLDACHTGVEIGRGIDTADPEFIRHAYELAEGFALIAASTAQQVAQEWREKAHGVFTYYLLDGLSGQADRSGKGFITVDDLKTHVLDGLRRWNVQHSGLLQEPTARTEGLGDIILADHRSEENKDNAPASQAPSPRLEGGSA